MAYIERVSVGASHTVEISGDYRRYEATVAINYAPGEADASPETISQGVEMAKAALDKKVEEWIEAAVKAGGRSVKKPEPKISENQLVFLAKLTRSDRRKAILQEALDHFGRATVAELAVSEASEIIEKLKNLAPSREDDPKE